MKNQRQPSRDRRLGAGYALLALLLTVVLPTSASATGQAPLHERSVQVVTDETLGTIAATLIGTDEKSLDGYADARIEVVARFDTPTSERDESRSVVELDGPSLRADEPGLVLELDLSGFVAPAGATGFDVFVRGTPPGRKPLSWVVMNHYFVGGNQIGIESITRCHSGYLWTFWATWTNIIWNQTNCPTHGFQLNQPGSSSKIQTQFDGAYYTRYKTWVDGYTEYWTFYPGGF